MSTDTEYNHESCAFIPPSLYTASDSLAPGRCDSNFKSILLKLIIHKISWDTCYKIFLRWMPNSMIRSQQLRQQAITWHCFDNDLCHHMTLLGHNRWMDTSLGMNKSDSSKGHNNNVITSWRRLMTLRVIDMVAISLIIPNVGINSSILIVIK